MDTVTQGDHGGANRLKAGTGGGFQVHRRYSPQCDSSQGDLSSLLRRLPHRINQAVQVYRRLKGGMAWGDVARADPLGKARIQLADIVWRPLGHSLGHI